MKQLVVVQAGPFPDALRARCDSGSFSVRLGPEVHVHAQPLLDEHLVVDADACAETSLLDCADVLRGSRPRSRADAVRRLSELTSRHPACGIAAVPLAGPGGTSGWAAASGGERSVIVVRCAPCPPRGNPGDKSLLPSCLHTWRVMGRSLRTWPYSDNRPLS